MSSRPSSFALTTPGPLRLYSTDELLRLPPPTWLIQDTLPAGGLVALYGQPGCGKSFVAIDMALSVAAGGFWQGRPVAQGYVLYVSAEGGSGIGKRARAWLDVRGLQGRDAPVAWLLQALSVYGDSNDLELLMGRIHDEVERYPTLIIIDTLARCFDGNENEQEDMGRFIKGVDLLRTELGSAVLVVHHTRLDGERERGNTAFRGACDTMMALERKGGMTLSCTKQKDAEEFKPIALRLRTVPGTDSCAIGLSRAQATETKQDSILDVLTEKGSLTTDEWLGLMRSHDMPKSTFHRHLVRLRKSGQIIRKNGQWEVD